MNRLPEDIPPHELLSRQIIGVAMKVHRTLGCGFVESIYRSSLVNKEPRGKRRGIGKGSVRSVAAVYDCRRPEKARWQKATVIDRRYRLHAAGGEVFDPKGSKEPRRRQRGIEVVVAVPATDVFSREHPPLGIGSQPVPISGPEIIALRAGTRRLPRKKDVRLSAAIDSPDLHSK